MEERAEELEALLAIFPDEMVVIEGAGSDASVTGGVVVLRFTLRRSRHPLCCNHDP